MWQVAAQLLLGALAIVTVMSFVINLQLLLLSREARLVKTMSLGQATGKLACLVFAIGLVASIVLALSELFSTSDRNLSILLAPLFWLPMTAMLLCIAVAVETSALVHSIVVKQGHDFESELLAEFLNSSWILFGHKISIWLGLHFVRLSRKRRIQS